MAANKMDWGIWLRKVCVTAMAVLIAGGISVWQDNPYWLVILPIAQAIQNYLKHR